MVKEVERRHASLFNVPENLSGQSESSVDARLSTFRRLVTSLTPDGRQLHNEVFAFESFYFISDGSIVQALRRESTESTPSFFREKWFEVAFREPIVDYGKDKDIVFFLDTIFRFEPNVTGPYTLAKSHALYNGEKKKHSELSKLRETLRLSFKNFANPNYYVQRSKKQPPETVNEALHFRGLFVPIGNDQLSGVEFLGKKRSYVSMGTSRDQKKQVNQVLSSIDPVRDSVKW